jgi:hypothetical protein
MYLHRPEPSWPLRIIGSARTLAAIALTALLAAALTVNWSDASATGGSVFAPDVTAAAVSLPVTVAGTLVGASDDKIAVIEQGAESPVAFRVTDQSLLTRNGENVSLDALHDGDAIRMTIDGRSGLVMRLHATADGPAFQVPAAAAMLAALGLIVGAAALAILNLERLPALPFRSLGARLLPVEAAR